MTLFTRICAPRLPARLPLAAAMIFLSAQSVFAHEFKLGELEIKHPWSKATLPGQKVAAGYFVIANHGSTPDRLLSVTAELSGKAEIHEMSVKNDVMTMRPVEGGLEIPANGEVKLEPGAFHVMFMDLKSAPQAGVKFPGTLTFEKAGTVAVEYAVEPASADGTDHSKHGG